MRRPPGARAQAGYRPPAAVPWQRLHALTAPLGRRRLPVPRPPAACGDLAQETVRLPVLEYPAHAVTARLHRVIHPLAAVRAWRAVRHERGLIHEYAHVA